MTRRNLHALLHPDSVAVIGATEDMAAPARIVIGNLLAGAFPGSLLPVSPKTETVAGMPAYPSVTALPHPPDLALICTPAAEIADMVTALAERGTKAACILTPWPDRDRDKGQWDDLRRIAAAAGMRLLGPGSAGLAVPAVGLNAGSVLERPLPGRIAFVSQSSTLCATVLGRAAARGLGFSHFIHTGDEIDVEIADLLDHLGGDPSARAIMLCLDSVRDGRAFLSAARAAARNKPVLAIMDGEIPVGSNLVFDAAFRRAGMLRVGDIDEIFAAVETLDRARPISGRRIGVITNGGRIGMIAANDIADSGGDLPALPSDRLAALRSILPPACRVENPLDIGSDADAARYGACLDALLAGDERDRPLDAILIIHTPQPFSDPTESARAVVEAARRHPKTALMTCWIGNENVAAARHLFAQESVPSFDTPHAAIQGLFHLLDYRRNQDLLMEAPSAIALTADRDRARAVIEQALAENRTRLSGPATEEILSAYDIETRKSGPDSPPIPDHRHLSAGIAGDPVFGPVILFGWSGGAPDERAAALPPLNTKLADDLIERTRVARHLATTGDAQTRRESLGRILVGLSQMAIDLPQLAELDIGRLVYGRNGYRAVNAHIRLDPTGGTQPAIRPYPTELEERVSLADGRTALLRPIRPEDEPNHHRFISRLTPEDMRFRFFGLIRRLPHAEMARLTQIDYDREMAFIAEIEEADGVETVATIRTISDFDKRRAEFAIVVRSDLHNQGLGTRLMDKMLAYCRSRGTEIIAAQVLRDNPRMLHFAARYGFHPVGGDEEIVEVERDLRLEEPPPNGAAP